MQRRMLRRLLSSLHAGECIVRTIRLQSKWTLAQVDITHRKEGKQTATPMVCRTTLPVACKGGAPSFYRYASERFWSPPQKSPPCAAAGPPEEVAIPHPGACPWCPAVAQGGANPPGTRPPPGHATSVATSTPIDAVELTSTPIAGTVVLTVSGITIFGLKPSPTKGSSECALILNHGGYIPRPLGRNGILGR
jgi:hypothetical protein